MRDINDFTCVFCGQSGSHWIRTTTGWLVCDTCGERQPKSKLRGKDVTFTCACGRKDSKRYCGELRVNPITVDGERRVNLITVGAGGCVLSPEDRYHLLGILANHDWAGE